MCPSPTRLSNHSALVSGLAFVFLSIVVILALWTPTPLVYKHPDTGACLGVESADPAHSCSNLPRRYETVWAERMPERKD